MPEGSLEIANEIERNKEIQTHPAWTLAERIAFRFACVYLTLYCLPTPGRISLLAVIPFDWVWPLTSKLAWPWHMLCPWVAVHLFHLSGARTQYHPTGSGDTTLDYVQVFCFLVLAVIGTLVWSILDRKCLEYRALYGWLRVLVRYTLVLTLLSYGFVKVFPLQFRHPGLVQLSRSYGESSPMGLLWTFMGASTIYTIFAGISEVTSGLLLFFCKTAALGAFIGAAVMLNVVVLNFCYDVPVKLYSAHLLFMLLFLLLPNLHSLWRFFILHQTASLQELWPQPFQRRWLRIGAVVLQVLVIASVLYGNLWGAYKSFQAARNNNDKPAIYGVWDVDSFHPSSASSSLQPWQRLVVEASGYCFLRFGDSTGYFQTHYDGKQNKLSIKGTRVPFTADLVYTQLDGQHLVFTGTVNSQSVTINFHRIPADHFLLISRGFHWINEDPFNR